MKNEKKYIKKFKHSKKKKEKHIFKTPQKILNKGLNYVENGKYDEALKLINWIADKYPENDEVLTTLGRIYVLNQDYDEAILKLNTALNLNNKNTQALTALGIVYARKKEYENAIKKLNEALTLNPKDDEALITLGNIYNLQQEYKNAIEVLNEALKINSRSDEALTLLGRIYIAEKKDDRAIKVLNEALKINSRSDEALTLLGKIYINLKKNNEAIEILNEALEINPRNDETLETLGGLLFAYQNKDTQAIKMINKSLSINPKNHISLLTLGMIHARNQEFDQAIEIINKSIAVQPLYESFLELGKIYAQQKQFNEAIKYIDKALKIQPKEYTAFLVLGRVQILQEKYDKAIQTLNKVLENDLQNAEAYSLIGNAYLRKGNYDKAISNYESSLDIDSENEIVLNALANVYMNKKKYIKALEVTNESLKINLKNADTYVSQAIIYEQMSKKRNADKYDNLSKAEKLLKKALKLDNKNYIATLFLGIIYQSMGKIDFAENYFKDAKNLSSENEEAYYFLGVLYKSIKKYEDARKEFMDGIQADTAGSELYYNLATVCNELEDYKDAEYYIKKAITKKASPIYIETLSDILLNQKQYVSSLLKLLENLGKNHIPLEKVIKLLEEIEIQKEESKVDELISTINTVSRYNSKIIELIKLKNEIRNEDAYAYYSSILKIMVCVNNFKNNLLEKDIEYPDVLYQYTSVNTLSSLLMLDTFSKDTNLNIRLYNTDYMNDPEEGKAFLKKLGEYLQQESKVEPQKNTQNIDLLTPQYSTSHAFIASLTKNKDEIPMWSTYGNNNKGVSIGFGELPYRYKKFNNTLPTTTNYDMSIGNMNMLKRSTPNYNYIEEEVQIYKVFYIDFSDTDWIKNIKNIDLSNLISEIKDISDYFYEKENSSLFLATNYFISLELDRIKFLIKNATYSYENEYRLLKMIKYFNTPDAEVKYDKNSPKLYLEVSNVAIEEVIFGVNSDDCSKWRPIIEMKSPETDIRLVKNSTIKIRFS